MKTNTNSRYAVAVLIDGDNASFEKMEDIMGFVSRRSGGLFLSGSQ